MFLKRFLTTALGALPAGLAAFVQRARGGLRDAIFGGISQSTRCLTVERGKAMKRGTTMVLKRFVMTALSALGMSALAAGTALAQAPGEGNIPAPKTFEGALDCGVTGLMIGMPTVIRPGNMASALDVALRGGTVAMGAGMGDPMAIVIEDDTNTTNVVENQVYLDLLDVVPVTSEDLNCGSYIGDGYEAVLTEFNKVVRLEDLVERRQKAVDDATSPTDAQLQLLERAEEDLAEAMADLDAVGMGPIYQAAIAEWRAKGSIEQAISGFNEAVGEVTTAETAFHGTTGSENAYARYVQLGAGAYSTTNAEDATNPALAGLAGFFTRGAPNDTFDDDAIDRYAGTENDNFTATGELDIPMADDPNSTDPADMIIDRTSVNVEGVQTNLENARTALAGLQALAANNVDTRRQEVYDEAVRRAALEVAHYEGQWADLTSDETRIVRGTADNLPGRADDDPDDTTLQMLYNDLQGAEIDRDDAEEVLRGSAMSREEATRNVLNAFGNPGTFYEQLVSQIQADIDELVDEDASARAISGARRALATAQEEQAAFAELVGDGEGPAAALLNELFKVGGDDGQALVDAISETYGAANSAKTTADSVAEAVEGLTGEGGDVAMNTRRIETNEKDIEELDKRVIANESEIWDAEGNSRIDANEDRSMANAMEIGMDENGMSRIDHNEMRSMNNAMEIGMDADGMSRIDHNEMRSNANNQWIMDNSGRLDTAYERSMNNESAINGLTGRVGNNETAITGLRGDISGLQDQMEVVRAGVAASMALAGMPAINGRGVSIGIGSYDGESAFAVGFQIQGEMASFKVGVTSAGGETGASAGVGFQF